MKTTENSKVYSMYYNSSTPSTKIFIKQFHMIFDKVIVEKYVVFD